MSKVWRYGDHIDTDVIIPARYLNIADFKELAEHAMEDAKENLEINFAANVQPGDYIVAGKNFGCGSSREHAPAVIKESGIACIVAHSFARIFFRNAINIGLPVIEIGDAVDRIQPEHRLRIEASTGTITNLTTGDIYEGTALPAFIQRITEAGGLIPFTKERTDGK